MVPGLRLWAWGLNGSLGFFSQCACSNVKVDICNRAVAWVLIVVKFD